MKILFRRQRLSGRKVTFELWCKLEFGVEETDLLNRCGLTHAVLDAVPQPGLWKKAVGVGFAVLLLSPFVLSAASIFVSSLAPVYLMSIAPFVAIAAGYFWYHANRETIYVSDLRSGRYFQCKSVIELARKEAYLHMISGYLRQVLQSAKHWKGTEELDIVELSPDEAKKFILSGPLL